MIFPRLSVPVRFFTASHRFLLKNLENSKLRMNPPSSLVSADNEWSSLKSVIVGRAGRACFPPEPKEMIAATMPATFLSRFQPKSPFPEHVVAKAEEELDQLASILSAHGVQVYRTTENVDWLEEDGYTGAMPRDAFMSVGNTLIESLFAWKCRATETPLAYNNILEKLSQDPNVRIVRRPQNTYANTLMDPEHGRPDAPWVINNSRPAFDTADFMRFGNVVLGQRSQVTNPAGIEYVRSGLPPGYSLEILDILDDHAMHIDTTLTPLRQGLLVYNPQRVTLKSLRKHNFLADWELVAFPFEPEPHTEPPLFTTSAWLAMNVLVIDGKKVITEAQDHKTKEFIESLGMTCVPCPFRHVFSLGGSFHCATVDLVREA